MIVREAVQDDARAMAEVHVRAWQDGYRGQMPDHFLDGMTNELDVRTERWKRVLVGSEDTRTWVAVNEGRVVGIATAGDTRDDDHDGGELLMINCVADAWGTGAGQQLLDEAVAYLRARSFSHATLWVLDSNARARRFYERNGWEPDGATKTDDRDGFVLDEVRYHIDL